MKGAQKLFAKPVPTLPANLSFFPSKKPTRSAPKCFREPSGSVYHAHAIALAQLKEHAPTEWSFSSLEEGEIDDADWSKNLPEEIIQNVLKECQLSVCRCFGSEMNRHGQARSAHQPIHSVFAASFRSVHKGTTTSFPASPDNHRDALPVGKPASGLGFPAQTRFALR
jgi:hypothetical protein